MPEKTKDPNKKPGISSLLKPYGGLLFTLIIFALFSNSVTLWLPKIIQHGIDDYMKAHFFTHTAYNVNPTLITFSLAMLAIFVFAYLQTIVQTYTAERVARDLRA